MRKSLNANLYIQLLKEIICMHNDIEYRESINSYMQNVTSKKRKQFPASIVGAEYHTVLGIGFQHIYAKPNDFYYTVYNSLIKNFGALNIKDSRSGNCVGHCGENYAATEVLRKLNRQKINVNLSDIKFTNAIQPRTFKKMDWCSICHKIFD